MSLPARLLAVSLLLADFPTSAGEVRHLQTPSRALGAPLSFSVYLPDGYARESGPYPVVYLLHGLGASARQWVVDGRIAEVLDGLIGSGEIAPLVAVMPDADSSWYVDSAALGGPGDYETAIVRDLVNHIDATFATRPHRRGRAVAGLSMGGFGALRFAFFHPDRFGAAASLSGGLFEGAGLGPGGGPMADPPEVRMQWLPGTSGTPFDPYIYRMQSPFSKLESLSMLEDPPAIMLTVGDDDYFELYYGTLAMFLQLKALAVPVELRVADGGHDWQLYRRHLPEVLRFFAAVWSD